MEEDEDEEVEEVGVEMERKGENELEQEEEEDEADGGLGRRLHLRAGMPPQMDLLGNFQKNKTKLLTFEILCI